MKKIVTIIGARPQFIKAAPFSRMIRSDKYNTKFQEILVHTGQHYDANMSDVFFEEMEIPKPDYHLSVGGGLHGEMTGNMIIKIEEILIKEKPDVLLIYGDTNSTLAGAVAAGKLHIPIAHVEAGLRSFWKRMPEEQNRIMSDHISTYLYSPTQTAIDNLKNEGIDYAENVGDIMLDAYIYYSQLLAKKEEREINNMLSKIGFPEELKNKEFALLTIHRAENVDSLENLKSIFKGIGDSGKPVIFPIHPRTLNKVKGDNVEIPSNVHTIDPVGYFEILLLQSLCSLIITDSGGMQKEAFFAKKPCITLRNQTEWVETVSSGWNIIVGNDSEKISQTIKECQVLENQPELYGKGNSAELILNSLEKGLSN
ncbi:UDP-N-acetylglucosamine 2-epimerase (non-hydrolyzing) [Chryseobacterium sp. Alg-005]|uniref:non-hydrolyzing UDP-N-acetylglucosamine 2-epimerase n=1 Tax=Chryseobacterium sp. Alg-005 TaxID=3159516 RepID=UPI00355575DB